MANDDKRVIAYVRALKSSSGSNELPCLSDQTKLIQDYCTEHCLTIDHTITDENGVDLSNSEKFDEMISYEQNSNLSGIVVANSRLVTSDIYTYFYYKMVLRKEKMELWSVIEDFGKETSYAPILDAFTEKVAEKEKHNLVVKTSAGRNVKAKLGGYSGGAAPYGYVVQNRQLVINPEQAKVVKEIFELRQQGGTYKGIAAQLNEEGKKSRSGKPFSFSTVRIILDNKKTYEGYYHYKGLDNKETWVRGQHEPILKEEPDTSKEN